MNTPSALTPAPGPGLVADCPWCGAAADVDLETGSLACPHCDVSAALADEPSPDLAVAA